MRRTFFKSVDFHEPNHTRTTHTIFMDFYGLSYTPLDRPFGSQAQRPDPKARGTVFQPASVDEFDKFRAEIYTKKMGKLIKLINIISYTTVVDDYLVSMIYIYIHDIQCGKPNHQATIWGWFLYHP